MLRGPQFPSVVWKSFMEKLGVSISLTSGYHLQTKVERANQEIGRFLQTFCVDHPEEWSRFLQWASYQFYVYTKLTYLLTQPLNSLYLSIHWNAIPTNYNYPDNIICHLVSMSLSWNPYFLDPWMSCLLLVHHFWIYGIRTTYTSKQQRETPILHSLGGLQPWGTLLGVL